MSNLCQIHVVGDISLLQSFCCCFFFFFFCKNRIKKKGLVEVIIQNIFAIFVPNHIL